MWCRVAPIILMLAVVLSLGGGSAANLIVNAGTIQVFRIPVDIHLPSIAATVDIKPESLQKKSAGRPVTVFIELPSGFDVSKIEVATVRLCRGTAPCTDGVPPDGAPGAKPKTGDADNDGIPDLKVTFDRAAVIALVADVTPPATVSFTVSGIVSPPGRIFAGSDTVKLVDPGSAPAPAPPASPEPSPEPSPSPDPSPEPAVSPEPDAEMPPEPGPSPEVTPEPPPEPTPTPTPSPDPQPDPTPEPTAEPTPEETPEG